MGIAELTHHVKVRHDLRRGEVLSLKHVQNQRSKTKNQESSSALNVVQKPMNVLIGFCMGPEEPIWVLRLGEHPVSC